MAEIRLAQFSDARMLWDHYRRNVGESGRDGDFIFSPAEEWNVTLEDFVRVYERDYGKTVLDLGWRRTWVISDANLIYGALSLEHRPPIKSCLHRAFLMMGIERSHRGNGFGKMLMKEALTWAKEQPTLDWLQLYVFEGNEPAKKLYADFGFIENGTTPDMFRVHNKQVADTSMILKLQ